MSEQSQPYTTTPPPSKREELEDKIYSMIVPSNISGSTKAIVELIESREKELREEVRLLREALEVAEGLLLTQQAKHGFIMRNEAKLIKEALTQKTTDDGTK